MSSITVDFSLMPEIDKRIYGRQFRKIIHKYFEDPAHQAEFEEWKKNRRKEKARKKKEAAQNEAQVI